MRLRAATVLAAVAALVAIAAPPALAGRLAPGRSRASVAATGRLSAQIRYTTGGIPHILAHGWTSLGFGYGYAFAKDNLCTMANDYVTVGAQRSRYFGPTGVDIQRGNGVVVSNLDSDLFFQQIIDSGVVQHLAQALTPTEKQVELGYTKGYNAYLAQVGGAAGVPDPTCRGQAWVKPITLLDSYLRFYQLILLGSSGAVIPGIAGAAPPKAAQAAAAPSAASTARTGHALVAVLRTQSHGMGSNAVAIGSAGTRDHRGLLLGNPHFPWIGPERFYQARPSSSAITAATSRSRAAPGDPDGIYHAVYVHDEPGDSLTAPDDGSSFIQVVTWPRHGACPNGPRSSATPSRPTRRPRTSPTRRSCSARSSSCRTGSARRRSPPTRISR